MSETAAEIAHDHISHIPKVVTQHGLFLAAKDTPVISLKPGQEGNRRGFYTAETKAHRYNYIQDNRSTLSIYGDHIGSTTQPVHYKNPQKPLIPAALRAHRPQGDQDDKPKEVPLDQNVQDKLDECLASNEAGQTQANTDSKPKNYTASIWDSMYKSTFIPGDHLTKACMKYKRLRGPPFSVAHPPQCLSEEKQLSSYSTEYGLLGSNPMQKLTMPGYNYNGRIKPKEDGWTRIVDAKDITTKAIMGKVGNISEASAQPEPEMSRIEVDRIPTIKHELTRGTTRATFHIPGYQGFIPGNVNNPRCAQIECGIGERERWTNIAQQYHLNLPGYSGHIPDNAINDRGARQIAMMTTFGRDFSRNAGYRKPELNAAK